MAWVAYRREVDLRITRCGCASRVFVSSKTVLWLAELFDHPQPIYANGLKFSDPWIHLNLNRRITCFLGTSTQFSGRTVGNSV
ncbi:hypothetical protein [Rivularia sp. UHCC 0363]|uniref:hypothetical protein n=1 Tax=Rivularia sp. UHCC 0363 TaxID=3110244 RepID=UPI002B2145D7|nr:hypothetical protein [Rivularia sp. UHCC 0363]MEA5592914.1 hypothetical protein [Rivularia sp. UHCC 0363]